MGVCEVLSQKVSFFYVADFFCWRVPGGGGVMSAVGSMAAEFLYYFLILKISCVFLSAHIVSLC